MAPSELTLRQHLQEVTTFRQKGNLDFLFDRMIALESATEQLSEHADLRPAGLTQ